MNSCENIVGTVQPTLKIIGEVETPLGGGGGGGKDGISPTVEMIDIDGGTRIIITDVNGPKSADIMDGKDGVDGKDGKDGYTPVKNVDYFDGKNGSDGVSPTVSVSKSGKVTTVSITDKNGTKTATINDGVDGKDGAAGSNGVGIKSVVQTTTSSADGGNNIITVTKTDNTTSTFTVKNGSKGSAGKDGSNGKDGVDGKTPVKGVDYYTEADKAEIVAAVIESLGGNPIFGIVDENNNIIVNGDLPDGTYTVKYEMEGGKIINIGNLVLDSNVYYTVTKNLTNCTISNSATQAVQSGSYFATITANSGYELKSVSVTMGGSAVSVSDGTISIASVTGDIVITAVAEEAGPSYTNLATKLANGYRYSQSNGNGQTLIQANGCCACEDFIPFVPNTTVRVKGLGDLTAQNTMYYKSDKTLYTNGKPHAMSEYTSYNYDYANDIVTLIPRAANVGYVRFTGVLSGTTEDVVITVNEEIV